MPAPQESCPSDDYPRLYRPEENEYENAVALMEAPAIPQTDALFGAPPTDDQVAANPLFIRRYVVMLNGAAMDVPVGLFECSVEAAEVARDVRNNPTAHADRYFDNLDAEKTLFPRHWLYVSVIEFSGPVPMRRTEIFDID